jgi:glyoxylase-like metal-dependent hydrolase (beta-lactamase superfamily II)
VGRVVRERELGRGERILPGCWRLRLPTPMPGVPHSNAWALASGSGVILFDTGIHQPGSMAEHQPGSMAQLERALNDAGFGLDDVRLVLITHAHADHWGEAAPIREGTGCEVWMHPDHRHGTEPLEDPEGSFARRMQIARQCGLDETALAQFSERIGNMRPAVAGPVTVDRALMPGVEIDTDLGPWAVYETPGHAPSHVCLFQPERRLLISGDHLLGRPSLYFDYGYSDDPVGQFLASLDTVEALDARLCLSGHGRTFTDVHGHIEDTRALVRRRLADAVIGLGRRPCSALELAPAVFGELFTPATAIWRLTETLCYLRHLEVGGRVRPDTDGEIERWHLLER